MGIIRQCFLRGMLEMFTPNQDTTYHSTCKDFARSREQLHWQAWCGDHSTVFSEGDIGKLLVATVHNCSWDINHLQPLCADLHPAHYLAHHRTGMYLIHLNSVTGFVNTPLSSRMCGEPLLCAKCPHSTWDICIIAGTPTLTSPHKWVGSCIDKTFGSEWPFCTLRMR